MFGLKSFGTVLLAASTVIASPLIIRQDPSPEAIYQGLAQSTTDLVSLNASVNKFTRFNPVNLATALEIQRKANALSTDLRNLKKAADAISGVLNDDDSLEIASRVGTLQGPIASVLNNIVVKKPFFRSAVFGFGDLSKTVYDILVTQRGLIGEFGAALEPKISETFRSLAPALTAETQNLFNTAIAAYAKCSGAVCLPPINFTGSKVAPKSKSS